MTAVTQTRNDPDVKTLVALALMLLCVLNVADIITTRMILGHAGVFESNPISRVMLAYYRVDLIKAALLLLLIWRGLKSLPTVGWACATWFVTGYYALTIVSNLLVLRGLR